MPKSMATQPDSPVEAHSLGSGLSIWHRYDSGVKADLFSTAVRLATGTVLIDPITASDNELPIQSDVIGIVVTNENHIRAAEHFSAKFAAPIFAHKAAGFPAAREVESGDVIEDELQVVEIEGAAAGETALFSARDGGTLILGDALINFGSHGFTFLPPKYCSNHKLMRKSLRKLFDFEFKRMLFAHGTPIMAKARDRLATLLAETR
jgi:hypothetical protein